SEKIRPAALNGLAETGGAAVLGHFEGDALIAYAVPFDDNALWGALRGYLGVSADLGSTTGLVFTYQNETPGLGGRIDENWFKEQFRGLPIAPGAALAYGAQDGYDIDAISGATSSSAAVMRAVNKVLRESVF